VSCGGGAPLEVGTGVNAPGVVAVGVAFAVLIEEEVDEERSERPTARRKRSLSGIAVRVGLFSSKIEEKEVRRVYRGALVISSCLVCTLSVAGLDWTDCVDPLSDEMSQGMR